MSKEDFKIFAKTRPELADYVKDGSMSWQGFYELYDIYGNNDDVWNKYATKQNAERTSSNERISFNNIEDLVKKIDMNSVQKHIGTAQKAINLFKDFGTKSGESASKAISSLGSTPKIPRPLNKFFED